MKKILLFILFMLSFNIFSENLENLKKIDGITQKYIDNETIPGSVVLISKNGKIVNVHSNGDCKIVSKEIENVLSELDYRVDRKQLNDNLVSYTYEMPVTVEIHNR